MSKSIAISKHAKCTQLLKLTCLLSALGLLPSCVATSTEKLVKCVVAHSTASSVTTVDTSSLDQEFLKQDYVILLNLNATTVHSRTFLAAKKHTVNC